MKKIYSVSGMHCASCEFLIEKQARSIKGVKSADAKLGEAKVYLDLEEGLEVKDELNQKISSFGYQVFELEEDLAKSQSETNLFKPFAIALVFVVGFFAFQKLGFFGFNGSGKLSLAEVFGLGLLASISSCMAVVGSLVLSLSSTFAKFGRRRAILLFHLGRLGGFFVLGGVIGYLGSNLVLSPLANFILNLLIFLAMVFMGFSLLEVFPKLRIKLPKSLTRQINRFEGQTSFWAPLGIGVLTFVLPCGFTQAMQIYSLSLGSFLAGAFNMLIFALGTLPVLAGLSFVSVNLAHSAKAKLFFQIAGFVVIFFALANFWSALRAFGFVF